MTNPLKSKKLTTKSLWGKLNLYSSVLVMVTVVSGVVLFSTLTSKIQQKERAENLKALASTLARLVARPVSQGDYLLAENYINGEGLPEFIESIEVKDRSGHTVAGRSKEHSHAAHACDQTTSISQPILDPAPLSSGATPSAATIELVASSCDIVAAKQKFGLTSLGFGAVVFLILMLVNRASIYFALRPLARTVRFSASSGQLDDCVIESSPLEIQPLVKQIRELYQKVSESEARSRVGEFAAQVAHDIRSPLAALDSIVRALGELPEESRLVVNSAVSRIRDIANSLIEFNREAQESSPQLGQSEESVGVVNTQASVQLLSSLVDPLITEKRLQYRSNIDVVIEGCTSESSYGLFSRVHPVQFKRLLSNLIDNAVEAISEKGRVTVSISKYDAQSVCLSVRDSGKGIPNSVLPRLMKKGSTFGKPNGSGLGLYFAKNIAESWGGRLEITSDLGRGTKASVILPIATPPLWFVEKLSLQPGATVVVLDDDATIHQVWQGRLEALRQSRPESPLNLVHLSTPDEFSSWVDAYADKQKNVVYLVDYELCDKRNGLDLISMLGIVERSVLVTSRFEEPSVLERVRAMNVRLIPKGMAGFVPLAIEVEAYDAVLIDNDPMNLLVWETSARRRGIRLKLYDRAPTSRELSRFDIETPIYIDSDLGNGVRGENIAKTYFAIGFRNISLTTGLEPDSFPNMEWISNIFGKNPPWETEEENRNPRISPELVL